jgi:hypothetical protein
MGSPRPTAVSKVLHVFVLVDELVCDEIHQESDRKFKVPRDEYDEFAAWIVAGTLLGVLVGWLLSSFLWVLIVGVPCVAAGLLIYRTRSEPWSRRSITVGSSYENDLVLFGQRAPAGHTLFDHRQGAYFLDVPAGARGKISLGKKAASIGQLRRKFGSADRLRIRLDPRAKGRLQFGESTILFHFDEPKAATVRPPFPMQLKPSIDQMLSRRDQISLATSAAMLGSYFIYVGTSDVDSSMDTDEIDDRFVQAMGLTERPEDPKVEEDEEDELAQEDEEKPDELKEEIKPEKKPDKILDKKPEKFSQAAVKEARNVGIARVLGTYGGPGEGTVLDVIDSTENNLGDLFAQGMTTTVLADGGDITPFVPGGEGISLRGSAVETTGLTTSNGPELDKVDDKRERKITARTKAKDTNVFGDVDKNAMRAYINRRTSGLRSCYEKALRTQADAGGKMSYVIDISTMGNVTGVKVTEDTVGIASVKACAVAKIKGWRFPRGEDTAEIDFSVVFSGG